MRARACVMRYRGFFYYGNNNNNNNNYGTRVLLRFFCVAAAHCPQWEKKEDSPDTSGENSDSPYPPLTP